MKCFYHGDLDGKCAAYWVFNKFPDAELIEVDYRSKLSLETIEGGEIVYIVDFSFSREEMEALRKKTGAVVWIDHHKTAIDKLEGLDFPGIRRVGTAGCVLTWEWFSIGIAPYFTRLIGDYDVWKFEYGDTKDFVAGLQAIDNAPNSPIWKDLWAIEKVSEVTGMGHGINLYRQQHYAGMIESYGFHTEWEGFRCICCNGRESSMLFDSIDENTYDIMVTFMFDGSQWLYSLYTKSENIDVGAIAKKYGGGGHKGAAGFQTAELLFKER